MASQKDNLHEAAQDFLLIDQCFPSHYQHTEAGVRPIMGWTTTTRYPEYEDQYHIQFQNQNCHFLRPPARTALREPVNIIDCPSVEVTMKSRDYVYEVPHVARANRAYQVPFKTKDDVFSGSQFSCQVPFKTKDDVYRGSRFSCQVPPTAARTNKSNYGG